MRKCGDVNINDFVDSYDNRRKFTDSLLKFISFHYDIRDLVDNSSLVSFTPQGLMLSSIIADNINRTIYFFDGKDFYVLDREKLKSEVYPIQERIDFINSIETIVSMTPLSIPFAIHIANKNRFDYMHFDRKKNDYKNAFFINAGLNGQALESYGHEDQNFYNINLRTFAKNRDNHNIVILEFNSKDIDYEKLNIIVDIKGEFALCGKSNYKTIFKD
jgi:hypothetical protein